MTIFNSSLPDLSDYQAVVRFINSLDLSSLSVPAVPGLPPDLTENQWYDYSTGLYIPALPSGFYCIDAETTHGNTVVAMASAYDLISKKWLAYYNPTSRATRLKSSGPILGIAHRATFEHSLFESSYSLKGKEESPIYWLDTHTMASVKYHPAQISLCRAAPHIPLFRESNDLSLKGMAKHLLGLEMDKDVVDVFIHAKDDSWRTSSFQIHKAWVSNTAKAAALQLGVKKASMEEIQRYCTEAYPEGVWVASQPSEPVQQLSLGIEDTQGCQAVILTKAQIAAPYVWRMTATLEELFCYNFTDVAVTVALFANLWKDYSKLPYYFTAGFYHRSAPFVPLASEWFEQIEVIEGHFLKVSTEIAKASAAVADLYQPIATDGFDTSINRKGVARWKTVPVTVSSKRLSLMAQLRWNGQVLFTLPVGKGKLKIDGTESVHQQWYISTLEAEDTGLAWSQAVARAVETEAYSFFDNPNNTSKNPKDIGCFVTKAFQKYWASGQLTSDVLPYQGIIKEFCTISYWQSFRKRLITQLPIMVNGDTVTAVPRTTIAGTVTGRSICPIMLTMGKPDHNTVGSELYNFIKAPKGYKLVTADLDSIQNIGAAIIASLAEAYYTGQSLENIDVLNNEFSRVTILGTKKDRTTVPWLLAKQMGLENSKGYSLGKNALYAMIFGVGLEKLSLMMGDADLAAKTLTYFKGTRGYDGKFFGGIASNYFNLLAELANGLVFRNGETYKLDTPKTLFSGRPFPNVLKPKVRGKDLAGTANNAVLQTLDVDCLCYMVTRITEIAKDKGIPAIYCQSVHDMKQFLVPAEFAETLADVYQVAHREMYVKLLTVLGIDVSTMPLNNISYSGVEITDRWVKSLDDTGETLSYGGFLSIDTAGTADKMESSDTPLAYMAEDFLSNKAVRAKIRDILAEEETMAVD
jgi:hypothetical protein